MKQYGIFRFARLATPKPGEEKSEDAYAFFGRNRPWAHLAISDGCSDSCWAAHWARTLVQVVLDDSYGVLNAIDMGTPQAEALRNWIARAKAGYTPQPPPTTERLRSMAREGDYATFLYSRLEMRHPGTVTVVTSAIGDTCLFILTPRDLTYRFPIRKSREFEQAPALLWSKTGREDNEPLTLGATRVDGPFIIMACTDQVAEWFLRCHEHGKRDDFISTLAVILRTRANLNALTQVVPDGPYGRARHTDDLTILLATSEDGETVQTDSPFYALRRAVLEADDRDIPDKDALSAISPP